MRGILEAFEQGGNVLCESRQEEIGCDVLERSEHEAALVETRVWDGEDLGVEGERADVEDIEVQRAR